MEYIIDPQNLSKEELLYLENFELELRQYITAVLKQHPDLGVTPYWRVCPRRATFIEIESNAKFDIKDSLSVQSGVENFIKNRLKIDLPECSLKLSVSYKHIASGQNLQKEGNATMNSESDRLPDFLPQKPRYSFEQIILPEETLKRIHNDLNTIKHQDLIYHQWGFSEVDSKPKSILNFFGPPGTGKTMCAHAIAKLLDKPLLALNYSEIESKYVGDAAKNLKKAFDTATEINAVMFFDEADSFLGKRIENVTQGSDQALNSLRSQMLILLEEFEGIVLFATNLMANFDKAFESRILDHIKLNLPNREARADIIAKMLPQRLPLERRFTHEELLEASDIVEGFSGREIKGAILTMLLDKAGLEEDNPVFLYQDLIDALTKKKKQTEQLKAEEEQRRKQKIMNKVQEEIELESEKSKSKKQVKFKKKK